MQLLLLFFFTLSQESDVISLVTKSIVFIISQENIVVAKHNYIYSNINYYFLSVYSQF